MAWGSPEEPAGGAAPEEPPAVPTYHAIRSLDPPVVPICGAAGATIQAADARTLREAADSRGWAACEACCGLLG